MGNNSTSGFITIYSVLQVLFYLIIFIMFVLSNKLYNASRAQSMAEGTKFLIKVLSFLMTLFMVSLLIPFYTVLFQGFICY